MKRTILLADDERGIRLFCKQELEAEGFRVKLAQDGEEAASVIEEDQIDVVVLDEHMPRCSGLEAAKYIKSRYPRLPVILFSLDPDYDRYRSVFVDRTVAKTENLNSLKTAIAGLLAAESSLV
jgi:two-component system phosphate regulon response regulator PhoB